MAAASSNQFGHLKVRAAGDNRYIHALVAEAFLGPRPVGMQVAHNDGDHRNNAADNLRYATPRENNGDKRKHGTNRKGESHPGAKLNVDEIAGIRRALAMGFKQKDIAAAVGVTRSNISHIATGKTWS